MGKIMKKTLDLKGNIISYTCDCGHIFYPNKWNKKCICSLQLRNTVSGHLDPKVNQTRN